MRSVLAHLVAVAIGLCAASASAADYSRVGYWNTDFGILEVRQEWFGSIYPWLVISDGSTRIQLDEAERADDGRIAFLWMDNSEDAWGPVCDREYFVTHHWGGVTIEPVGEDRFEGTWMDCDLDPASAMPWHGVLIAGYRWMSEEGDAELMPDRPFLDLSHEDALALMANADPAGFDPATAQSFAFDMTCDGGTDQVFVWTSVDAEKGPLLQIAINHALPPVNEEVPEFQTAVHDFDVGGTGEVGICVVNGEPAPVHVSLQPISDEERNHRTMPASCAERLAIAADGCRPLAGYWSISYGVGIGWGD